MSQVDVHKGPEAAERCVIFERRRKVLFTVELKRREMARDEEGLRADHQQHHTMHHLFSAVVFAASIASTFLFYSILLEKLRWDAAAARGAISISTQTLPSTDWISNPLNQRGFHSLCFVTLLESHYHYTLPPISFLFVVLYEQRNDIQLKHDKALEGEKPIDQ